MAGVADFFHFALCSFRLVTGPDAWRNGQFGPGGQLFSVLVLLVTMLFGLCSLLSMTGRFPASRSVWTRRIGMLMLRLGSSSTTTVACFWLVLLVTDLALCSFGFVRSVTLGVMAGMDQKDCYDAKWWPRSLPTTAVICFLLVLLVGAVCAVSTSLSAGPPAGGRGCSLPVYATTGSWSKKCRSCGSSSRTLTSPSWRRGFSHGPVYSADH